LRYIASIVFSENIAEGFAEPRNIYHLVNRISAAAGRHGHELIRFAALRLLVASDRLTCTPQTLKNGNATPD
jgi:hypothetical protein